MKFKTKKTKGYRRTFKKYGVDPRSLQWTSRKAQEKRFRALVSEIDFEKRSVLDVGCGFGDIIPFISQKTKNYKYTGVDLVPEFIRAARVKYPNFEFLINDYFGKPLKRKFDIVLSSGTLNANIKNPYEYRFEAIKAMWEHTGEILTFNMAGGDPQPDNKKVYRVYYAELNRVVDFCKTLSKNLKVKSDYSSKDFTIIMFK